MHPLVTTARTRFVLQREEGQALPEYALILGLVAIVSLAALGFLGTTITSIISLLANKL